MRKERTAADEDKRSKRDNDNILENKMKNQLNIDDGSKNLYILLLTR